ncbi:MAG: formyltetrahydrofolate deformylase, partial [Rhodospirillaceae bacterium]
LTITCPNATGLVAAVAGFLRDEGCFIDESFQYGDPATQRFFMRMVFTVAASSKPIAEIERCFGETARRFDMSWTMVPVERRPRVMIAVSRFGHCLNDLLHRWHTGQLAIDIVCVVSNHDDMRRMVEWHGIPYHYLPVTAATKANQETSWLKMVDELDVDLVVLARYMQVLSPEACRKLEGRCINIHHSFLPSFKGARPYQQAYERGVKIIGATAHYVTGTLDEGPIIEQAVERVDHTQGPAELIATGRDLETLVLARAVRWHAERRVLINGAKTVVFR